MILKIMKVTGNSLNPIYKNGDFVMVSKIPIIISGIRANEIVVFDHPRYGRMIKRVLQVQDKEKRLFVVGENDESLDSRHFGTIPLDWVVAKVFLHISPRSSKS